MPGPPIDSIANSGEIPDRVDTVVVGGGIIGLFTALELCERGQRVAICDKGKFGAEQSSRNWGWVRVARRDPREIELVVEAQRLWRDLTPRINDSVGYHQGGIVFAADNDIERTRQESWLDHARPYQIRAKMLSRTQMQKRFPDSHLGADSALYCQDDGRAEPQMAAPAVARACQRAGVLMLPGCAARSVESAAGAVASVVTEQGEIRCDAVVVAAGAWSNLFCRNVQIDLPQLKVLSSVLRTEPTDQVLEHALWTSDFSVRKRADGGLTVASGHQNVVDIVPDSFRYFGKFLPALKQEWDSLAVRLGPGFWNELKQPGSWSNAQVTPFESNRVLDPAPVERYPLKALQHLQMAMPRFDSLKVAQVWAGMIDVTPDAIPVISRVDQFDGLHLATGFSGHGFGIAPGAGCLMADIVTGQNPVVDPHAYRFARFTDGSPITLG